MIKKLIHKYNNMSLALKAGLWFTICGFVQKGISFLTMPIFTRILSTEEYGQVSIYNSWLGFFSILVTFNVFYGAFNTAMKDFENEKDSYASSLVGFIFLSTVIYGLAYVVLRTSLNKLTGLNTIEFLLMLLQIFVQGIVSLWLARKKFDYKYIPVVIVSVITVVCSPLLSYIGIRLFPDYKVIAKIAGGLLIYLVVCIALIIEMLTRGRVVFKKKYWLYALAFSLPLLLHYLSSVVLARSDIVVIERMCGKSYSAIYSVADSLSSALTILTTAASQAIVPWLFFNIKSNSLERTKNKTYTLLCLTGVCFVFAMFFGPELLRIIAPKDYYEARWAIPPIMASLFFSFIYQIFANFEFYYKKNFYIISASLITALVNIGLNIVCIKMFGFIAAAYTTLFCNILFGLFHYLCAKTVSKREGLAWPYSNKFILLITIVMVISVLFVSLLYISDYIRYAILLDGIVLLLVFSKKIKILITFAFKKEDTKNVVEK